jgi:hypothetical protein
VSAWLLLALLVAPCRAESAARLSTTTASPSELMGPPIPYATDYLSLTAFPEQLVYDIAWGVLGVGQATLEVRDIVEFNGRPAYHVLMRVASNKFCDGFYKVRDVNESWIDARTLWSLGYSKNVREGGFYRNEWLLNSEGRWVAKWAGRDDNFAVATGTAPIGVQDILSAVYYLRGQPLEVGREIVLDVNTRQNWPLVIKVLKKERIKTEAGRFDAYKVEPTLRGEGIFVQKGNKMQIWLTDDPKHVPVMIKVDVFFGSITAKVAKMIH